jgi:hypothetical protein
LTAARGKVTKRFVAMPENSQPRRPGKKGYSDDDWLHEQVSPKDLQAWFDSEFDILEKIRRKRPEALALEIIAQSKASEDLRRGATEEQRRVIDEAIDRLRQFRIAVLANHQFGG